MGEKRKVVGIVQARMGATRLSNKSLLHLHGYPVIEWIFRRIKRACLLDETVFAIPTTEQDDPLYFYLTSLGANVYRGHELDLIDRFYGAAMQYGAPSIVRICADNPFVSGSEIDHLIEFFQSGKYDYAYNHVPLSNRYPDGLGAEIFPFSVLERLNEEAREPRDREHVSTYIRSHPELFRIGTFDPKDSRLLFPELKLDLDTPEDYEKLMRMKVDIDMEAHEIVAVARGI